jgi:hypothetical protein
MKIVGEQIIVGSGAREADGTKVEPEEQIATEVVYTPVTIALGDNAIHGRKVVEERVTRIGSETSAIELALAQSTRCELCQHFRNQDWLALKKKMSDPSNHEGRTILNKLRAELLAVDDTTTFEYRTIDHDVEHAIGELGVCAAWTEERREPCITVPYGGCPAERVLFTPRDQRAEKVSTLAYDSILRAAQGRK